MAALDRKSQAGSQVEVQQEPGQAEGQEGEGEDEDEVGGIEYMRAFCLPAGERS